MKPAPLRRFRRGGLSASRLRAFSAARNFGGCRSRSTPKRCCPGRRPRRWSRRRSRRSIATVGNRALRVADLGTGSGALLLALLSELPNAFGVGTDISFAALRCARDNAAALGLSARSSFVACDYGRALRGPVDLLVSNPPYVARADIAGLQAEVRDFDPQRALDGGSDGLDGYRAIASHAAPLLAPDGILVLELGHGQLGPVTSIFVPAGLAPVAPQCDLAGIVRALVMRVLP